MLDTTPPGRRPTSYGFKHAQQPAAYVRTDCALGTTLQKGLRESAEYSRAGKSGKPALPHNRQTALSRARSVERQRKRREGSMASGPFTLAQLARAVGMSVVSVEAFLDARLLQPARRTRGVSAEVAFHEEHIDRLNFIKRALELQFAPEEIARFVAADALMTCNDVYLLTERHLLRLRGMADAKPSAVFTLEQLMDRCARKGSRTDCPIIAAIATDVRKPSPRRRIARVRRRRRL